MKLLCQRGKYAFLVEIEDKYYLVNTNQKKKMEVESPDMVYKQGYCEEPNPTEEQMKIIGEIL